MFSWLTHLERRLGRYAISNLSALVVAGMGTVFVLTQIRPDFADILALDLSAVRRGEVWRLVTYLFLPANLSPFWIFFTLTWAWFVLQRLEQTWGAFRLNAFCLLGMLGTTGAAWITGAATGNTWLLLSFFFALATLFPEEKISLFLVLSVPLKWVGWATACTLLYPFFQGDWATRGAMLAALSNYLLFFGHRGWKLVWAKRARVSKFSHVVELPQAVPFSWGHRTCALCGAREDEGADIRVCSCAACGKSRTLCLFHARNHLPS